MSHIVTFCDKTIEETNNKIDQTDSILKAKLKKTVYEDTQKTNQMKPHQRKLIPQQRKFKKYWNLKYKLKPAVKGTNIIDENENLKKATYVEILRGNRTPTTGLSKTNNTDHNGKPKIRQKLRSLSPINRYKRQGNSQSRKLSNSNIKYNDK